MDMVNLNGNLLNNSLVSTMGMDPYADDMAMDVGNPSATGYNLMDAQQDVTQPDNKPDSSENVTTGTMSGAGAGPLPTGFGLQPASNAGSTLTEFTKRRNWSQRVIDELKDLLYILTPDGRLLYVSPSAKSLTGHDPQDLTGKFIAEFVHPDDSALFIREFNESIATGNPLRFYYRFRTAEDKYLVFETHGHPHLTSEAVHQLHTPNGLPINAAGYCRGFFMMARPYPTKNAELLDSFLEHKIENERLQARIAVLKREEAEEAKANFHKAPSNQASNRQPSTIGNGGGTPPTSVDLTPASPSMLSRDDSADSIAMPPPAKPTISNTALTREALDEANAFSRPDSITDKMARYEGASHVDSIEMLTGLRYREGERSQGISTGGTSPALIRGDAGIDIPVEKSEARYGGSLADRYTDGSKKPKKVKSADEYVCTDCGTLDSPEWRKGPMGPKTLCNACGLRWAKKEKKRTGGEGKESGGGGSSGNGASTAMGSGPNNTPLLQSSAQTGGIIPIPIGTSQTGLTGAS